MFSDILADFEFEPKTIVPLICMLSEKENFPTKGRSLEVSYLTHPFRATDDALGVE